MRQLNPYFSYSGTLSSCTRQPRNTRLSAIIMRTNFTECGIHYLDNRELSWVYGYNGSTRGIHHNFSSQVTYRGCKDLCGSGVDYYSWSTASATITTWLLPIVGMLLQAPFESNAFWRTMLAICRWVGSPMASLSYILWNIKVSGKCALMGMSAAIFFT